MDDKVGEHFSGLSAKEAWKLRRRVLYLVLLFSAAVILYILRYVPVSDLKDFHSDLVDSLVTLCGFLLLYWFFGSVIDDNMTKIPWGKRDK